MVRTAGDARYIPAVRFSAEAHCIHADASYIVATKKLCQLSVATKKLKGRRMSPSGRIPLADEPKNERLVIRLTRNEKLAIDAGALAIGKPPSTWARDLLLSAAHAAVKKPAKIR